MIMLIKSYIKSTIVKLYPLAYILPHFSKPYMCFITPVFDGCLDSLQQLIDDFQKQHHSSWIHVCVSNGPSPRLKKFLDYVSRDDPRIMYLEMPFESQASPVELLINLGKRRNYAMDKSDALRYMFVDADSALSNRHFIAQLLMCDMFINKDLLMVHTQLGDRVLPEFPINIGTMDMTNMVLSRSIAKKLNFPDDYDPNFHGVSDYRYFLRINTPHNTAFLPVMGCEKNTRRSYTSVAELFTET